MAYLLTDETFLAHDAGPGHPERPERLTAITEHLRRVGLLDRLEPLAARPAAPEEILRVHSAELHERVRTVSALAGRLDPDTGVSPRSFDAALRAAGALLAAADAVPAGEDPCALCLVRPPGHHATPTRAMGFCLFNNVAVAARYLQDRHGIRRVAVVDFDVHHGNGTEEIFRDDPSVFYLSIHRYPFYPGTGGPRSHGPAPAATRNIPLPAGVSREDYHAAWEDGLAEVREFAPEVILLSAGFDAHRRDPVGGLSLVEKDYERLTRAVREVAEDTAGGRMISALEGGYALEVLGPCVEHHLRGLDPAL